MADQLCTTAQVKTRLRITDAADDALISELIDGVSDWIEDATHRKLVPDAGATYVVDTTYGNLVYIRRGIRAITSFGYATSDQPDSGGTYTAITPATGLTIRPAPIDRRVGWPGDTIVLFGSTPVLRTVRNGARIVGDFGFAATPPAIVEVAIDAVVAAYATRGKPSSTAIGADDRAVYPWATFFSAGSPQRATVMRFRAVDGMA